jgi:hypothetical protein
VTKTCTKCGVEKPLTEYRSRGGKEKHLLKSSCNTCLYKAHRDWTVRNPDRVQEYRERDSWTLAKRCARRGITPEQLCDRYDEQCGKCDICRTDITLMDSAIDHNHDTGEFRGVLCKRCNRALGLFGDSPEVLRNAVNYLAKVGNYGKESIPKVSR